MLKIHNFSFFNAVKIFIASLVVSKTPSLLITNWIGSSLNSYGERFTSIRFFSEAMLEFTSSVSILVKVFSEMAFSSFMLFSVIFKYKIIFIKYFIKNKI